MIESRSTTMRFMVVAGLLIALVIYMVTRQDQTQTDQHSGDLVSADTMRPSGDEPNAPPSKANVASAELTSTLDGEVASAALTASDSEPLSTTGSFGQLLGPAELRTGAELQRAFALHDGCAGIPRGQDEYQVWLERHAAEVGFDFGYAETRYDECQDVPVLPFDRRTELIEPVARTGDPLAQYIMGTTHPLGSYGRSYWLFKSMQGGHPDAYLAMIEQLAESSTNKSDLDIEGLSWFLYGEIIELEDGLYAPDFEQLDNRLTPLRRAALEEQLESGALESMLAEALELPMETPPRPR